MRFILCALLAGGSIGSIATYGILRSDIDGVRSADEESPKKGNYIDEYSDDANDR